MSGNLHNESGPPSSAPEPPAQRTGVDQRMASMTSRGVFAALQIGLTLVAAAGGMVFYVLLVNFGHLNTIFALVLGLVFALVARHASASLVFEWLLARARASSQDGGTSGSSNAPPRR